MAFDLVLSSGFLAFARQVGFLRAVEEVGVDVDGVCGTSSGALIGVLWAAGATPDDIAALLTSRSPLSMIRPSWTPWRGVLSLAPALTELRSLVPPRFEDLPRPFGVGVTRDDGSHHLLTSGPLPEAVMASCAVPFLFDEVRVDGVGYRDGGAADRTGVGAWRAHRGSPDLVLHLVRRSRGVEVDHDLDGVVVVRSERSGASFFGLGDFEGQAEQTRIATLAALSLSA